ncbi:hypothetical protein KO481_16960 [Nocardia sp. NEAU-G5]|uniref:Uncharacterized protein n=1 Tax=Nocardia albiluteola TaxID=2842303 RepID=A0ABS6AYT4_9NOCA|nr:hypothetical protein [Nocardia albiluteola]MBU3063212.1 hypothetical protein [Nocardia albiluteola]
MTVTTAITDIRVLAYELADRISTVTDEQWKPARHPDHPDHAIVSNPDGVTVTIAPNPDQGSFQASGSVARTDPALADYAPERGHALYSTTLDTRAPIEDLAYAVRCDVIAAIRRALTTCRAAKEHADQIDRARRALLETMSEGMNDPRSIRDDESTYVRTWTFHDARVLIDTNQIVCSESGDLPAFHIHLSGPAEYGTDAVQFAHGFLTDYHQFTRTPQR